MADLNCVPILGPLTGPVIFLGIGMLSLDLLRKAFMPMAAYAGIHLIEGETVTPMLLARRFAFSVSRPYAYWTCATGLPVGGAPLSNWGHQELFPGRAGMLIGQEGRCRLYGFVHCGHSWITDAS